MNASVLCGIFTPTLYDNFGVKKTLILAGGVLTGTHLVYCILLNSDGRGPAFLLFLVGVVGGVAANVIFVTVLNAMLTYHYIINTNLVRFHFSFKSIRYLDQWSLIHILLSFPIFPLSTQIFNF